MYIMKNRFSTFALSLIFASIGALSACGEATARQTTQAETQSKAEIEAIVRAYILENPEIIEEAIFALDRKRQGELILEGRKSLVTYKDEIESDPRDFSLGPKDAKVTVVEFFDYNCGFCKRTTNWVKDMIEEYPNDIRFVFKELPVLDARSQTSRNAARVALAAARQGRYMDMHFALMNARGLSETRVQALAKELKLDIDKLNKDMRDPAIEAQINDTLALANRIPVLTGTPFFIINGDYVSGANMDELRGKLEAALKG